MALHGDLFVLCSHHTVIYEHALRFEDEVCQNALQLSEFAPLTAMAMSRRSMASTTSGTSRRYTSWLKHWRYASANCLPRMMEIFRAKVRELRELKLRVAFVFGARHRPAELGSAELPSFAIYPSLLPKWVSADKDTHPRIARETGQVLQASLIFREYEVKFFLSSNHRTVFSCALNRDQNGSLRRTLQDHGGVRRSQSRQSAQVPFERWLKRAP